MLLQNGIQNFLLYDYQNNNIINNNVIQAVGSTVLI